MSQTPRPALSSANREDLRSLPPSMRKANLARLLARRAEGIFIAPFEQGEIGPELFCFRQCCCLVSVVDRMTM
jgi:hypothetical protein